MPIATRNGVSLSWDVHPCTTPSRTPSEPSRYLVLINGLADDSTTWASQLPAFTAHFNVLIFDNRGVGKSSAPEGPYTTAQMAQDAIAVMDAAGVTRAHVLGVSMGGMIAQEVAINHPSRVEKLVLAATSCEPSVANLALYRCVGGVAKAAGVGQACVVLVLWCFSEGWFQSHPEDAAAMEVATLATTVSLPGCLGQLGALTMHNCTSRLHRVSQAGIPTLVLGADEDAIFVKRQQVQLKEALGASAGYVSTAGGHASNWEEPEPFNKAVLEFLGGQDV